MCPIRKLKGEKPAEQTTRRGGVPPNEQTGQLISKSIAGETVYTATYSPGQRMLTRTGGQGVVTTYGYDNAGRQVTVSYSDATPGVAYAYTRSGQIATVTRGDATHSFVYDDSGVMEQESVAGGWLNGLAIDPEYDTLKCRCSLTVSMNNHSVTQGCTNRVGRCCRISE